MVATPTQRQPRGFFEIGVFNCKRSVNLGTLMRSAYQLGAAGVFVIGSRYKRQSSDTCHADLHIPLREFDCFDAFKASRPKGAQLIAVESPEYGGKWLSAFSHPMQAIYMLGAEDHGLPPEVVKQCQQVVSIESLRQPSYNVAVAGSLVMYHRLASRGDGHLSDSTVNRNQTRVTEGAMPTKRPYRRSAQQPSLDNRTQVYGSRKYLCDFSFFDVIDTEVKAYWLGFIAADGCVRNDRTFIVALAAKDRCHLERLKRDLQATYPLYDYYSTAVTTDENGEKHRKRHPTTSLVISSQRMVAALVRQGVHPRKTKTLAFPSHSQVPRELMHHYVRGYFDGDGSIFNSEDRLTGKLYWGVCIISTLRFCAQLAAWFAMNRITAPAQYRKHGEIAYTIRYSRADDLCKIRALLYRDATVYLERKKVLFDQVQPRVNKSKAAREAILEVIQRTDEPHSFRDLHALLSADHSYGNLQIALGELSRNGVLDKCGTQAGKPLYTYDFTEADNAFRERC